MTIIPIPIFLSKSDDDFYGGFDEKPPRSFLLFGVALLLIYGTLPLTGSFFVDTLPGLFGAHPDPLDGKLIYQLIAMGTGFLGLIPILVALFLGLESTRCHWAIFWGGLALVLIMAPLHPVAAESLMAEQCRQVYEIHPEARVVDPNSYALGCRDLLERLTR